MDDDVTVARGLSASERVRLVGNPAGPLGGVIGNYMNSVNRGLNHAAFRRLGAKRGHRVLEIGFGNGKLLPDLISAAPDILYDGVDRSELMVAEATCFNQPLVQAGRAKFHHTLSTAIPFDGETFDRAVAINTIYFWPRPTRDLAEIYRVLKPDGILCLAAMTPSEAVKL